MVVTCERSMKYFMVTVMKCRGRVTCASEGGPSTIAVGHGRKGTRNFFWETAFYAGMMSSELPEVGYSLPRPKKGEVCWEAANAER